MPKGYDFIPEIAIFIKRLSCCLRSTNILREKCWSLNSDFTNTLTILCTNNRRFVILRNL